MISQSVPNMAHVPVVGHPCPAWLYLTPPQPTQRELEIYQTPVASAATVYAKSKAANVRTVKLNESHFESIICFG
jgi:hypothetical protein